MGSEVSLPHVHQPKYRCHHCNKSLDGVSIYGGDDLISDNMSVQSAKQKKSAEVKPAPMKKNNQNPEALPHSHSTAGPCYFCSEHKEQYEKLERYQPTWRAKVSVFSYYIFVSDRNKKIFLINFFDSFIYQFTIVSIYL